MYAKPYLYQSIPRLLKIMALCPNINKTATLTSSYGMSPHKLKINLLEGSLDHKARRTTILAAGIFALFVGVIAAIGADASYRSATRGTSVFSEVGHILTFNEFSRFPWNAEAASVSKDITTTPDNRLNILLLGVGGDGHDGSQLTDTIILASLDTENHRIGMLSIPRDMAYPLGGGRFEKINAVNAYAEQDHPGEGSIHTAAAFSKLLNIRIDRVLRIDFKGFAQFIDSLGGIDLTVARTFIDKQFPTEDDGPNPFKWTVAHFEKGPQHMDGKTALTFARSRHGSNGEGSDFARSARQQLVIEAVRSKLFSLGVMTSPNKLSDLWNVLSNHVQTNMTVWDAIHLMPLAMHFKDASITRNVLSDDPQGLLTAGNVNGAFMLFPKDPDWSDIRKIVDDPFSSPEEKTNQMRPTRTVTIEIKNGTQRIGFAAQIAEKLSGLGYTAIVDGNASYRSYQKTVIYDLTNGGNPDELAKLKTLLNANVSASAPINGFVQDANGKHEGITSSSTHFLIILGNSTELVLDTAYARP